MLSILIPIFNNSCEQLLASLQEQCQAENIAFEIIVGNDSTQEKYQQMALPPEAESHVHVINNPVPLGRSGNRNKMAEAAQYDHLLFIDGDAEVEDATFIKTYMQSIRDGADVVCGGTRYHDYPPEETPFILRWKYGLMREATSAAQRSETPWNAFASFNFLVRKSLFMKIGFDEDVLRYGHEDTLFGLELKQLGVEIIHLDNGLIHRGLEPADIFLKKTRDSVLNLYELYQSGKIPPGEAHSIKLLKVYLRCRKWGFKAILSVLFRIMTGRLERNLKSTKPNIRFFDWYKLGFLLSIS